MVVLKSLLVAVIILLASSAPALAADPAPGSKNPGQPPASQPPQLPPPAPPSKIDPGIQKQPDTVPDSNSKAIVQPPVVDPNMAVDPEKPRPGATPIPPKPDASPAPKK